MIQAFKLDWCLPAVSRVPANSVVVNLDVLKHPLTHGLAAGQGVAIDCVLF